MIDLKSKCFVLALLLCLVFEGQSKLSLSEPSSATCICDIEAKTSGNRTVELRGTAMHTPDGLVIFDRTCPVARNRGHRVPRAVLVEIKGFSSLDDWSIYEEKTASFNKARISVFQVVASGILDCRRPFRTKTNEEGEIVLGNGFGSLGLIECRIKEATVRELHALN
jgi:hypothetical protein